MTAWFPFRWRALTPEQERAICHQHAQGAAARQLADQYGVSERTIYRVIDEAAYEWRELTFCGYRATFAMTTAGPAQRTPWVPAE